MMSTTIITTDFVSHQNAIKQVRENVFIKEQNVPPALEWDGEDNDALHLLALDNDDVIGTARMLNDGHIGRMAVLPEHRQQGVGSMLLTTLIELAKARKLKRVFLSAQVAAIPFYKNHQFVVTSDEYMDAGIPHKDMERDLT